MITLAPTRRHHIASCACGWSSHGYVRRLDAQARADVHLATHAPRGLRLRPALATAVFKAGAAFPAVGAALVDGWRSA